MAGRDGRGRWKCGRGTRRRWTTSQPGLSNTKVRVQGVGVPVIMTWVGHLRDLGGAVVSMRFSLPKIVIACAGPKSMCVSYFSFSSLSRDRIIHVRRPELKQHQLRRNPGLHQQIKGLYTLSCSGRLLSPANHFKEHLPVNLRGSDAVCCYHGDDIAPSFGHLDGHSKAGE